MSEDGQRDPGTISSIASDADEECSENEPVRTTAAEPRPFTDYAPMLRSALRSASSAVTSLAASAVGTRRRTASRDQGNSNVPRGSSAIRANGNFPEPGRKLTPRRHARSGEGRQAASGTPPRRRIRSQKSPVLLAWPVARPLPDFPLLGPAPIGEVVLNPEMWWRQPQTRALYKMDRGTPRR